MRHETAINQMLGNALKKSNRRWNDFNVKIEETQMLAEYSSKRPDIIIIPAEGLPVIIETSFNKNDADQDAIKRLGMRYKGTMDEIKTAVAVNLDTKYKKVSRITTNDLFKYAIHQKLPDGKLRRFPEAGFIVGNFIEMAALVESTYVTKEDMEKVAQRVSELVNAAANKLSHAVSEKQLTKISKILYQRSSIAGLQTTALLWLNALLVQRTLSAELDIPKVTHSPSTCISVWKKIHSINWKAIFEPAIHVLDEIRNLAPSPTSDSLKLLIEAVEAIEVSKLGSGAVNIGAELFPLLLPDRKDTAAFYTQPAAAEFLASITIQKNMVEKWSEADIFKNFKIADLACGTGTLLRFSYRTVRKYHEQDGGDESSLTQLHNSAMEEGLYGTDVSPIAAHLTSSSLAMISKNPYGDTHIGWVGVGNSNRTGSIEYIQHNSIQDLFFEGFGMSTGTTTSNSSESVTIKDNTMSVIIMNPPYSRTTINRSSFNIGGLTKQETTMCQKRWSELIKNEPCIKTAGMAATFLCIAAKKVKRGGRIGFVLPKTAAFAESWRITREMIESNFSNVIVIAVVSGKALGRDALSADTHMEEMFLVGSRRKQNEKKASSIRCVTLFDPLTRIGEAREVARAVSNSSPNGPIFLGTQIGTSFAFEVNHGDPWSDLDMISDALQMIKKGLLQGKIVDFNGNELTQIKMTSVEKLFNVGMTHDIIGHVRGNDPRGAFTMDSILNDNDAVGKYRSLWNTNTATQKSLQILPTHKGTIYRQNKYETVWSKRTSLFVQKNLRWTTQSLVCGMTKRDILGGNAWLGLSHKNLKIMKAFALWSNSIYGMIVFWATGSRTHQGRSLLKVKGISKMKCPNFESFTLDKLQQANDFFDAYCKHNLQVANMAYKDDMRQKIDAFVSKLFDIPTYDTVKLAELWCLEPSVATSTKNP